MTTHTGAASITRPEVLAKLAGGEEDMTTGERLTVLYTEARSQVPWAEVRDPDRVTVTVIVTVEVPA